MTCLDFLNINKIVAAQKQRSLSSAPVNRYSKLIQINTHFDAVLSSGYPINDSDH